MWEVLVDLKGIVNKNWDKSNFISLSLDKSKVKVLTDATYFLDEIYGKVPLRTRAFVIKNNIIEDTIPKPLPSGTSPFAKPASKDDSGKLTTYGAGGGAAAERAGQTQDQVMRQGAINRERKNKPQPVNQGPDFGR